MSVSATAAAIVTLLLAGSQRCDAVLERDISMATSRQQANLSRERRETTNCTTPDLSSKWSYGASSPLELGEVASAIVGDTVYVVGEGRNSADTRTTASYNLRTQEWSTSLAPRPFPGHHHVCRQKPIWKCGTPANLCSQRHRYCYVFGVCSTSDRQTMWGHL